MKFAEEPPPPRPQTVEITLPHNDPGNLEDARREAQAKMPAHVTVRVVRAAPPDPRLTLTAKHPLAIDVVCAAVPDALVPLLVEHPTWSLADAEAEREYRERFGHPSERSNVERRAVTR